MPHKFDDSAASNKAIKKEVQAKGLGVPQSTGKAHDHKIFTEASSFGDAPYAPSTDTNELKNPHSAGTDSKVGGAGATGSMEVTKDALTSNIPPEYVDRV